MSILLEGGRETQRETETERGQSGAHRTPGLGAGRIFSKSSRLGLSWRMQSKYRIYVLETAGGLGGLTSGLHFPRVGLLERRSA